MVAFNVYGQKPPRLYLYMLIYKLAKYVSLEKRLFRQCSELTL